MSKASQIWREYNNCMKRFKSTVGRTNNVVGEYAEHLANKYLRGRKLLPSAKGADIESPDGKLYQVKGRRIAEGEAARLSIIRGDDSCFHYLFVIVFNMDGDVKKAIICPASVAQDKRHAKANTYQNGYVITTTASFLNDPRNQDVTEEIRKLNR